jgi:hypothetical protein
MQKMVENQADSARIESRMLFAITAQAIKFKDGYPTIFQAQQAFFLQPVEALVGVLPRYA